MAVILFPGRFDRPHIGHVLTILRLAERYDKVLVVVLGYNGEKYSAHYRYQIIEECFKAHPKVEVSMNDEDWRTVGGRYTVEECKDFLLGYKFDVYGTGNHVALNLMAQAGAEAHYVERAYDYNATDDRLIADIKKVMGVKG